MHDVDRLVLLQPFVHGVPLEVDGVANLLHRRGRIPPGRARSGGPGHLHVVDVAHRPGSGVFDLGRENELGLDVR